MLKRGSVNPPRPFRLSVNVPELIADTQQLDPEQFGCYMRLLLAYWRSGPLRDNDRGLARVVGLSPDEWVAVRPVIESFFDVVGGRWTHWRTDQDLEAAYAAINANRERTKAATAARRNRRAGTHDARDDDRDEQRNVERDVVRYVERDGAVAGSTAKTVAGRKPAAALGFARDVPRNVQRNEVLTGIKAPSQGDEWSSATLLEDGAGGFTADPELDDVRGVA